MKLICILMG